MLIYYNQVEFDVPNNHLFDYVRVESGTYEISSSQGITLLKSPAVSSRCTYKYKPKYFYYNNCKFELCNLEVTSLSIIILRGFDNTPNIIDSNTSRIIIANDNDKDWIINTGLNQGFIRYVEGTAGNLWSTCEGTRITDNLVIDYDSLVIDKSSTVDRYYADMTVILSGILDFWSNYLKGEFTLVNELRKSDSATTKNLCYFKYSEWLHDLKRQLPCYNNEIQEYQLPISFKLVTSSISKYERIVADMRTLKFFTNQVLMPNIKDKKGELWNIPIRWDSELQLNSVEDPGSGSFVSYEISINGTITMYNVLKVPYGRILNIILNGKNIIR